MFFKSKFQCTPVDAQCHKLIVRHLGNGPWEQQLASMPNYGHPVHLYLILPVPIPNPNEKHQQQTKTDELAPKKSKHSRHFYVQVDKLLHFPVNPSEPKNSAREDKQSPKQRNGDKVITEAPCWWKPVCSITDKNDAAILVKIRGCHLSMHTPFFNSFDLNFNVSCPCCIINTVMPLQTWIAKSRSAHWSSNLEWETLG